jgi:hypothetical protein
VFGSGAHIRNDSVLALREFPGSSHLALPVVAGEEQGAVILEFQNAHKNT